MVSNELCQLGNTIKLFDWINVGIDNPRAHRRTGRWADHRVRPPPPPRADLRLVRGRVLEAVRCERFLIERIARENGEILARVFERGVELGRGIGLRLRAHKILPPRYWTKR